MSALRPKWFSEVEEGVRDQARQAAADETWAPFELWAGTPRALFAVDSQIEHDAPDTQASERQKVILFWTFVEEYVVNIRRRLEEAE